MSQVSATGGETVPLSTPFPNVALDNISADKSELLVGTFTGDETDQPLWAVPVLGGSPRRLGDVTATDGAWMPNGDLLVARGNDFQVVNLTTNAARKFASLPDFAFWLRWSPNSRALRFSVDNSASGVKELWEMSADGSGMHRLLPDWRPQADSFNGNWTPDGKYFVFQSRSNGRADLWAIPEKGDVFHKTKHEPVQLTSGPLSFYGAQPSQDGKHIFAIGEQPRGELQRFDAKSGHFVPYLD